MSRSPSPADLPPGGSPTGSSLGASPPAPPAPSTPSLGALADRAAHWQHVYTTKAPTDLSWYEEEPALSLALIDRLGVRPDVPVVDVGAGTSRLVDCLLARGFTDVTAVDVSEAALAMTRSRVGPDPRVTWVVGDVLTFVAPRPVGLWHDRAVLHFLAGDEVAAYSTVLRRSVDVGGAVVLATFAPDGPTSCSGLPVTRYDAAALLRLLGDGFVMVDTLTAHHRTPWGSEQSFTWLAARRIG